MRCHICDAPLGEPQFDFEGDHGDFAPCETCLSIIDDATGLKDQPTAAEDDFAEDEDLSIYDSNWDISDDPDDFA